MIYTSDVLGVQVNPPEIEDAFIDVNNQLIVFWSTRITEIVTIAVVVKNTKYENESTVFVEWNERDKSISVDPLSTYNVTVIVFDICRQNVSSETVSVESRSSTKSFLLSQTPSEDISKSMSTSTAAGPRSSLVCVHESSEATYNEGIHSDIYEKL